MIDMNTDDEFVCCSAGQVTFAISQRAVFQRRINDHLIVAVFELKELIVSHAEAPVFVVVRIPERNPVGMRGNGKYVLLQLTQGKATLHRHAVTYHVEARFPKVDDTFSTRIRDISITDIPLFGHSPIENRRASRNLMLFEDNQAFYGRKCLANSFLCDTAANRIKFSDEVIDLLTQFWVCATLRKIGDLDGCCAWQRGFFVYNGEHFLERSVSSILNQSFSNFELVISDNCSTDRSEEICQSFAAADPRIRYFRNQTNMGAGWNSRRVLELAEGKYFKWAAHDDMCEPQFLELCLAALESDPEIVLACTAMRVVDEGGALLKNYSCQLRTDQTDPLVRFEDLILIGHRCYQIFGLIRVDILRKLPPIGSHAHSDRILLLRLGLTGPFYEAPEYLFTSTKHPGQSVWTTPKRLQGKGFRLIKHSGTLPALEWWDPTKSRKISFPEWKLLSEYTMSLFQSRLRPIEKALGIRYLLCWVIKYHRRLMKDIVIALDQMLYNLQNPSVSSTRLKST